VDLSMPRLIDPAVAQLPGTCVIDLEAIQDTVEENRRRRAAEVPKVEALAERELAWLTTAGSEDPASGRRAHQPEVDSSLVEIGAPVEPCAG
jgi:glutamyl-tRNA reductase